MKTLLYRIVTSKYSWLVISRSTLIFVIYFCSWIIWKTSTRIMQNYSHPIVGSVEIPELINFKGRFISQDIVHPGNFRIEVPWSEVANWGDKAIVTYRATANSCSNSMIDIGMIEAWTPDITSGVFRHSTLPLSSTIQGRGRWFTKVDSIENGVMRYSGSYRIDFTILSIGGIFLLAIIAYFPIKLICSDLRKIWDKYSQVIRDYSGRRLLFRE